MNQSLERMQILMAHRQRQRLMELAGAQKRSVSDLIREAVDRYLEQEETRRVQARRAIHQMKAVRESLLRSRSGQPMEIDAAEFIRQMREERTDELGRRVLDY